MFGHHGTYDRGQWPSETVAAPRGLTGRVGRAVLALDGPAPPEDLAVTIQADPPTRHVRLDELFNVRDLGGLPGRRTVGPPGGRRSTGPTASTGPRVTTSIGWWPSGLRTVIDLRTPGELERGVASRSTGSPSPTTTCR